VLEVGAGYTSVFLLQALVDNAREIASYRDMIERGAARLGNVPWAATDFDYSADSHKLHIVDNCAHEHTTAHKVADIAEALGCRELLEVHIKDAFDSELPSTLALPEVKYFDLLWIDLGAANRIEGFFDAWWHRVNPRGGFVIVHSTLTNLLSREWLEKMRRLAENGGRNTEDGSSPYGAFVTVSFLEPHKMFQNSCSLFQKRGDALQETWTERILTKYP
jgi:Zn-dependent protease with chaperone function